MNKVLKDVLARAEQWPEWAQHDLAELAAEIDREVKAGPYQATPEELAAIDEGLAAAQRGEFATEQEVEAVFAKYRRS